MDFREIIRRNNQRTKLVIVSYMLIMTLVGLLVDTVLNANPYWGLAENLWAFASFQQMPYATLLILALTVLGIIAIHFWGHKMMLTGMNAREISPAAELSRGERQLLNIVEELSLAAALGYILSFIF